MPHTDLMGKLIILLFLAPFIIYAVHILLSSSMEKQPPQIVALFSIISAQAPVLFLLWLAISRHNLSFFSEALPALIYSALILFSLSYCYFHLFNMSETARRIRILHEIAERGPLSFPEIEKLYGDEDIINARLKRLLEFKQLALEGNRYRLKKGLLYWTAVGLSFWRAILGMENIKNAHINPK